MGIPTSQPQPRPYATRSKTDSRGRDHWQIYLPSKRGHAWVELFDFPDDREFRDQILDPDFLPEWKLMWLEDPYQRFRDRENARKRKGTSYSSWSVEPWDDEELDSRGMFLPELYAIRQAEQTEAEKILAQILLPLTDQQKKFLTLSLGEGLSYADIARRENPDADQSEINKLADAVRNSVNRALKRIHKRFGGTRPDSTSLGDV